MRAINTFLTLLLVVYLAFNVFVYAKQRDMMYLPTLERIVPAAVGLDGVEEVYMTTAADFVLVSWFAPPEDGRPTVLFFHGNAGAVNHRAYRFKELMEYGYGVFVLGYPGYGGSGGQPTEAGFHEGANLAYDYLRASGIEADDIVIYGESIGSGVAVQLAARVEAKGLVLEAPMSSAVSVAREHYPLLVASFFLSDRFRSDEYIDRIDMPLLVIHGGRDAIIPLRMGQELVDRADEPKKLVVIEGAGHNDLNMFAAGSIARDFIESLTPSLP